MFTIFAVPKPFQGHIGLIQENAIRSWVALDADHEVILLGDEDGTAEVSRRLGVRPRAEHPPQQCRDAARQQRLRGGAARGHPPTGSVNA